MDGKYGRLFTEQDVRKIVRYATISAQTMSPELSSEQVMNDVLDDKISDDFNLTFPKDEPLFLLRAKDKRSLGAVRHYHDLCDRSVGVGVDHLDGVEKSVRQFEEFRADNPDRMKDPD